MTPPSGSRRLTWLGGAGLFLFLLFKLFPAGRSPVEGKMIEAAEIMASAENALRACREARGKPPDPASDVNRTGLIGIRTSPITTTLGSLEAKRTTTNPNFAGLAAGLLADAGVKRGDVVAVGASSSFPALVVAVLAAARAMEVEPLLIWSLGASQWGANDPAFDGLDMFECLGSDAAARVRIIALAVGGTEDRGSELSPEGRRIIEDRIRRSGLPVVAEPDLERDVAARVRLYFDRASGRRIGAFVNIGGSSANIGTDPSVLHVAPGLARIAAIPPAGSRGVLQEMASLGIPVIHLLNIKDLAAAHSLPWDPSPLPRPGEGDLYARRADLAVRLAAFLAIFAGMTLAVLLFPGRKARQ